MLTSEVRQTSAGSDARWREEVMPGETSGEVMRRKASAEVMPPSVGRIALKSISGRKAGKNIPGCNAGKNRARSQCRRRTCRDARLASPGGIIRSTVNGSPSSEIKSRSDSTRT